MTDFNIVVLIFSVKSRPLYPPCALKNRLKTADKRNNEAQKIIARLPVLDRLNPPGPGDLSL
jgi:hypothetical protein